MSSTGNAAQLLEEAAALYRQRNAVYGNNYKRFGHILATLFPEGLVLRTADDWNRMGVLFHVIDKLTRYTNNFANGGHADSLCDAKVYIAMLEELDNEINHSAGHGNDGIARTISSSVVTATLRDGDFLPQAGRLGGR